VVKHLLKVKNQLLHIYINRELLVIEGTKGVLEDRLEDVGDEDLDLRL